MEPTAVQLPTSGFVPKIGVKRQKVDLATAQQVIRNVIELKTSKDTDVGRHVSRLFGRPSGGLTPPLFKKALRMSFGLRMTDREADKLWEIYDPEGIGAVPLTLFVKRVMPKDYTRKPWNVQRDEEWDQRDAAKKRAVYKPVLDELPPSLHKVRWNMDKIAQHIQQKIVERTKRASDQYREAFALFGSPAHGISPKSFKVILEKLGFVLSPAEMTELFGRFDSDGSGHISFQELVGSVMPKDYTEKQWMVKRDEENYEKLMATKAHKHKPVLQEWPDSLKCNRLSMREVEDAIQAKIVERTKRASDQYREAFALFGSPAHGITPAMFKVQLSKLGLVLSDGEIRALFKKYDSDGSGNISFQELVSAVMPPDYPRKPWNVLRDEEMEAAHNKSKTKLFVPVDKKWPASMGKNRWTIKQIESMIQQKIIMHTKRASDQYREAFALFGSPAHGITKSSFRFYLNRLGIVLQDSELNELFDLYDGDGSGNISFQELVGKVMPSDYSRPTWNTMRQAQIELLEERKQQAMKEESPYRRVVETPRTSTAPAAGAGSARGSARVGMSLRSGSDSIAALRAKHRASILSGRSRSSGQLPVRSAGGGARMKLADRPVGRPPRPEAMVGGSGAADGAGGGAPPAAAPHESHGSPGGRSHRSRSHRSHRSHHRSEHWRHEDGDGSHRSRHRGHRHRSHHRSHRSPDKHSQSAHDLRG